MHFHAGDNDPKHTSELIKDWLKRERIQTFSWPSYFNPIENLWDELEQRIKKYQSKNMTELELLLIQEWKKLDYLYLKNS